MTRTLLPALALTLASPAAAQNAPEISTSSGVRGGVVLLWPRIIPSANTVATRPLAAAVQTHLDALIRRRLPGKTIDKRPEPQRVCGQAGCTAMAVGALIARRGSGCVLVGLVSRPGKAPFALIPWVGEVTLKQANSPFRGHPESHIKITDFAACAEIPAKLASTDQRIGDVIVATARVSQ